MLGMCMGFSIYNYVLYILSLYVRHVNFCYGMLHCLCSSLVKLIVTVQPQHIMGSIVIPI